MTKKTKKAALIPTERITQTILVIRGQKVILDADLAGLYGVTTKRLNEQIKRNVDRFPSDFMFRLSKVETAALRSQNATTKGRGGRRYSPYAFTEHGAIMAANVLSSPLATEVSIYVVRAFIKLREELSSHQALARKIAQLEHKYDAQFKVVFDAIRQLMEPPAKKARRIGFKRSKED